jgi:hypothetical protein
MRGSSHRDRFRFIPTVEFKLGFTRKSERDSHVIVIDYLDLVFVFMIARNDPKWLQKVGHYTELFLIFGNNITVHRSVCNDHARCKFKRQKTR